MMMDLWGAMSSPSLHLLHRCLLLLLLLGLVLLQAGPQGVQGVPDSRDNGVPAEINSAWLPMPDASADCENWKARDSLRENLPPGNLWSSSRDAPLEEPLLLEGFRESRVKRSPLPKDVNSYIELEAGDSLSIELPSDYCCVIGFWRITGAASVHELSVESTDDFHIGNSSTTSNMCPFSGRLVISTDQMKNEYCGTEPPPATRASESVVFTYFGSHRPDNFRFIVTAKETPTTEIDIETTTTGTATEFPFTAECGAINRESARSAQDHRIIGGEEAAKNKYPWVAVLVDKVTDWNFCGGSLISRRWILSAAHCVILDLVKNADVLVGAHDLEDISETRQRRAFEMTLIHPRYDDYNFTNDIGLGKMTADVFFSPSVQPALLDWKNLQYAGRTVTVIGWGLNDTYLASPTLQEMKTSMISRYVCGRFYDDANIEVTEDMICSFSAGNSSCQGDSGGPIIRVEEDGGTVYGVVIGVVSWGIQGCTGRPSVFASVGYQIGWVKHSIGESELCSRQEDLESTTTPSD